MFLNIIFKGIMESSSSVTIFLLLIDNSIKTFYAWDELFPIAYFPLPMVKFKQNNSPKKNDPFEIITQNIGLEV